MSVFILSSTYPILPDDVWTPIGVFDNLKDANEMAFTLDTQHDTCNYRVVEYPLGVVKDQTYVNLYDFNTMKVENTRLYEESLSKRAEETQKALDTWNDHCKAMKKAYVKEKLVHMQEEVRWFQTHPEKTLETEKRQRILQDTMSYFEKFDPMESFDQDEKILYSSLKSDALIYSSKRF